MIKSTLTKVNLVCVWLPIKKPIYFTIQLFLLLFMCFTVFLVLFISLTVLFQLSFTFIYNTFNKIFNLLLPLV